MAKSLGLLVLSAFLPFSSAQAQIVEGIVVNSLTGAGIPGIGINLEQVTTGAYRVYQVRTDSEGRYRLDDVQDGTYAIRYASNDYGLPGGDNADPPRIQVTAGEKPVMLEARMLPLPRVSGRVLDGRGNPVPKARVDIDGGMLVFGGETDAAGKFDIRQLPGTFTLSAVPPADWKPPDPEPESGRPLGWARTYYPGSVAAEGASKFTLRLGADMTDLELKLVAVPVHAVRGVLLNPDGTPAPKISVALDDDAALASALRTESKADGTFEFPAVPDGRRLFAFEVESGGQRLRADQWIEIAGRDLEGIKVRLIAPFPVHGKVVFEAPADASAPAPKPPSINLSTVVSGASLLERFPEIYSARPDADGSFVFPHIYPGAYRVEVSSAPAHYYFDAVRLGESELPTPQLELTPGAPPITVVFKLNGGAVRGAVEKCASGTVLLIPQDTAVRQSGFVFETHCDPAGHYQIDAVRPGEYYALALTGGSVTPPALRPRWDDATLAQAAAITVRAGETTSADLRAVSPPQ